MDRLQQKTRLNLRRQHRTRTRIKSDSSRPRLSVNISHKQISAQIIDATSGQVLASASSLNIKSNDSLSVKATLVGEAISQAAKASKIKQVVFDRGGRLFHGRLKLLAEAARKGGLEF